MLTAAVRSVEPLWRGMALLWWKRALKEMGPLHPDAPRAVLRIADLEGRRHA